MRSVGMLVLLVGTGVASLPGQQITLDTLSLYNLPGVWVQVDELPAAAERDGFRTGPRILASATGAIADLGHDEAFASGVGRILLRFAIELPPLREISDDIPAIAEDLMQRIGAAVGRSIRLSPAAVRYLREQRWPGNGRQLERVLERAISFSRGRQVRRVTGIA